MESPFPPPALDDTTRLAPLSAENARRLLRKVRDLDLHAPRLTLSGGRRVQIDGCLSVDSPIENSLRYRVRIQDEPDHVIEIAWRDDCIEVDARVDGSERVERHLRLRALCDAEGRALLPEIQARAHPDTTDPREVEHFLRRLVRAGFASETRR